GHIPPRPSPLHSDTKHLEYGGAIFVLHGSATVTNSSFVNNRAKSFGGALHSEYGGIAVSNSTFHGNAAAEGGALNVHFGSATLTHVTMADNVATQTSGDEIANLQGRIFLRNSIIHSTGEAADCTGGLTQSAGNLSPDGSCAARASADPRLGKLIGSPAYRPLLDGSPAVDAALAEFCPASDQIGRPRPYGGGCDIGAIESTTAIPAAPTPAPAVCSFYDQIIAANTDRQAGACPAGNGADTITLREDITLQSRLPEIISGLTIEGSGHSISGAGRVPIFTVRGAWLKINNLTMTEGNNPRGNGGAINMLDHASVVVNNSSFIRNEARNGGAITMFGRGSRLVVYDSRFTGNITGGSPGGNGGAIDMRRGELHISGSSFSGNRAFKGGAIDIASGGEVNITNSTFSGNYARGFGGALAANAPQTTLRHVTMVNNEAKEGSGVWARALDISNLRIRNSIIAGGIGVACSGPLTQNIGNLIEDGSCSPRLSGAPLLGEWTGSPGYHEPQDGSPAVDAADPRFCPPTDQLGNARPHGGGCDIGAIESGAAPPPVARSASADTPPMTDCLVTTTHALNFRDGPSLASARIGHVPQGATVKASDRTQDWFSVEYRGIAGWISADYVVSEGNCDIVSPGE
ncbi:MAG: SH3 domain-containing protein, partial [Chloroflexota bacterium]|nr:SH3 domain-containing protein [Chloroflexota bacterium]MDE2910394.1 SH3 domain-containing protein [Chloroflexota bacterium]